MAIGDLNLESKAVIISIRLFELKLTDCNVSNRIYFIRANCNVSKRVYFIRALVRAWSCLVLFPSPPPRETASVSSAKRPGQIAGHNIDSNGVLRPRCEVHVSSAGVSSRSRAPCTLLHKDGRNIAAV